MHVNAYMFARNVSAFIKYNTQVLRRAYTKLELVHLHLHSLGEGSAFTPTLYSQCVLSSLDLSCPFCVWLKRQMPQGAHGRLYASMQQPIMWVHTSVDVGKNAGKYLRNAGK